MLSQIGFDIWFESEPLAVLESAKKNGFSRAVINASTVELASSLLEQTDLLATGNATILVDRLKTDSPITRIRESLETAFDFGHGSAVVFVAGGEDPIESLAAIDGRPWDRRSFSRELICQNCNRQFPQPTPQRLSFNNRLGACEECEGLGKKKYENGIQICKSCAGRRLNPGGLSFRIANNNLADLAKMKVSGLIDFLNALETDGQVVSRIVKPIVTRLQYLEHVGLSYLALDRSLATLSGGELQRVSLTTSLSSTLVNMLYVLDEPTIGIHAYDVDKLTEAISRLHARGNTLVVVDHEEKMIRAAERIIEIGPAAGVSGGSIVFDGSPEQILEADSLTGDYLAGRRGVSCGASRRTSRGQLKLFGASGHNLKNIDVNFPLGCMCVVTGVSGAGKSSLVQETLYGAICEQKQKKVEAPLPYQRVAGDRSIDEAVLIDQSPIGRSGRSNPVTYVKAFDEIRKTFAETAEAKSRNLSVSHFSFNVAGGRCDKCEGDGCLKVDMQFLADVVMTCDQCQGTRFRDEVLMVRYRGKSIAEVLAMTVREAFSFFRGQPKIQAKLKNLIDVGLEYIQLGQPATRLSTGEAQRLKLALYLNANRKGRSLFILDEPTTGLHMNDVVRLLDCLNALLDVGHSMIIVEHNLQLIKNADWIIDLGPGAAEEGGHVVAAGTPEQLSECKNSLTGAYLKPLLELVADE